MTIRFACECGKRLRAPNHMAGRRTKCPSCSFPVDIPARRFGGSFFRRRGTGSAAGNRASRPQDEVKEPAAPPPATPRHEALAAADSGPFPTAEQRPVASTFVPSRAVTAGLDPVATAIALRHPPRWSKLLSPRVEARWYHSLTYPAANVPIFFKLATMLTILTAVALLGWLSIDHDRPKTWPYGLLGVSLFLLLLVLGRTLNYFNSILALATQGRVKHDAPIEFEPFRALLSCGQWFACLLAGPAVLFGSALGYWLYCGDLTVIDWLILAELCFAGVGWWLIAILLTNVDGAPRVPMPGQVLRTALGMGWKAIELTLLAAVVFLAHLYAGVHGIGHLHDQPLFSFALLCVAATTGLYFTAFTFRRLGLAYYRVERKRRATGADPGRQSGAVMRPVQEVTET
jgi:hypothetical protein